MARTAYTNSAVPIRTHQGNEYDAFARITRRMKEAATRGKPGFNALVTAIHENRRLWTILAGDVADDGNTLHEQLRAQIFYLAEFTGQHSAKVLSGKAGVEILIEINMAVMRGLRQQEAATP